MGRGRGPRTWLCRGLPLRGVYMNSAQDDPVRAHLRRKGWANPTEEDIRGFRYWSRRMRLPALVYTVLCLALLYPTYHYGLRFGIFITAPFGLLGFLGLRWYSDWLQRRPN